MHERELALLARRLRALLLIEGGFTVDRRTGERLATGWAVGADPARSLNFPLARWSEEVVVRWLRDCRAALALPGAEDRHLGGWLVGGSSACLDVVRVVPAGAEHHARLLARRHGQRAFYSLGHRSLVPADG